MLLAYLQHFADTDSDGKITAGELCTSLAPFVPGPPEAEVQREAQAFLAGDSRKLFPLIDTVIAMQPALLHALFVQHGQEYRQQQPVAVAGAAAVAAAPAAMAAVGAGPVLATMAPAAGVSSLGAAAPIGIGGGTPIATAAPPGAPIPVAAQRTGRTSTTGGPAEPLIPGSKLKDVVTELLPGVAIKPEDMTYLINMVRGGAVKDRGQPSPRIICCTA